MLDVTWLLLGAVAAAACAGFASRRWRTWWKLSKLPGYPALPFIGMTYTVFFVARKDLQRRIDEINRKYWPIQCMWIGSTPEIHMGKAELMEAILTSSEFIEKAHVYRFLRPWLGDGLLTSTGRKWHSHRKMITPAFHFNILEDFIDVFAEKSELLVQRLQTKADGHSFDMYPYITCCALDIVCETAMGTSVNALTNMDSPYVTAVCSISELTLKRFLSPWLHSDFIFRRTATGRQYYKHLDVVHSFTKKVVKEKQSLRALGNSKPTLEYDELGRKRRVAFLDMLLDASEDGKKMNDQEVQDEVNTFMFEGHDTTSVAMLWTLFLLGHHTDVQERVYAELEEIFHDNPTRRPTMKDLNSMKYLEMVIKETLRLYPSVPIVGRIASKDVQIGGYTIPAGTMLMMHLRYVHRDPSHWPEPERFNPDNFLADRVQGRHPFAYVPFSAGPRNCIGQRFAMLEEKTVLSSVLRRYRVQSVDRPEDARFLSELVLRPLCGIFLRLVPR